MADLTRADLRSRLQSLAGVEVTDAEANGLLEEGHRELCTRSEWTRAELSLGPTVAGQAAYTLPTTLHRPLKVWKANHLYKPSDAEAVRRIANSSELWLRAWGLWWLSFAPSGVETLSIYPTPAAGGDALVALSVVYPSELSDSVGPALPREYQMGPVYYAASQALELVEDDPEIGQFHRDRFEEHVSRLRRHRFSRSGRGPVQLRVAGVHA